MTPSGAATSAAWSSRNACAARKETFGMRGPKWSGLFPRLTLALMLAIAGALLFGPSLTGVAHAQGPGVAGGFEIDGNLVSDAAGQGDWIGGSAGAGVLLGSPNCGQQNSLYAPAFFRRDGFLAADTTIGSGKNSSGVSAGSSPRLDANK